jgi:hypothetical protein
MKRHREPIKFLFLPKMGLLGSQAGNEKMLVVNYEQLLRAVFHVFMAKNNCFQKCFYILGSSLKGGKYFGGLWFYSKGCLSATPSFSLLGVGPLLRLNSPLCFLLSGITLTSLINR